MGDEKKIEIEIKGHFTTELSALRTRPKMKRIQRVEGSQEKFKEDQERQSS